MSVIIAGNGPSLKEIDYSRIPENAEVYRCNQFYFEDKYYLGKSVNRYFINPSVSLAQYFTKGHLQYSNQYNFEQVILSNLYPVGVIRKYKGYSERLATFSDFTEGAEYFNEIPAFYDFLKFKNLFFRKQITSGVFMCGHAVAVGHKKLFITGLDFYEGYKNLYAFDNYQTDNLKTLDVNMNKVSITHHKNTDVEALQFLVNEYGIEIYCLSPNSVLCEYFPLAPLTNNKEYKILEKPENYINDVMIPDNTIYRAFNITLEKEKRARGLIAFIYKLLGKKYYGSNSRRIRYVLKDIHKEIQLLNSNLNSKK